MFSDLIMSSKTKRKGSTVPKKAGGRVRLMVRLAHSGRRIAIPDHLSSTIDPATTLSNVISFIQSDGTLERNLRGATLVHMRETVPRSKWDVTTLGDIGIKSGESALLTLKMASSTPQLDQNIRESRVGVCMAGALTDPGNDDPAINENVSIHAGQGMELERSESMMRYDGPNGNTMIMSTEDGPMGSNADGFVENTLSAEQCLHLLRTRNVDSDSKETVLTLLKMITALIASPTDKRVRCINPSNANFRQKVANRAGAGV